MNYNNKKSFFVALGLFIACSSVASTESTDESGLKKRKVMQSNLLDYFKKPSLDGSEKKIEPSDILMGVEFNEKEGATLIVDSPNSEGTWQRKNIPILDQEIAILPLTVRYCFGIYDLRTHTSSPCLESKEINKSYRNCFSCNKQIGFNPSFYFVPRSSLSPQQQAYNARPHNVYLVAFSPEIVKVGIAQSDRLLVRLTEQGARLAIVLGNYPDAYEARRIEEDLSGKNGLKEGVTAKEKFSLTMGPMSPTFREISTTALLEKAKYASSRIGTSLEGSSVINLDSYYFSSSSMLLPSSVEKTSKVPSPLSGLSEKGLWTDPYEATGGASVREPARVPIIPLPSTPSSLVTGKVVGCVGEILFLLSAHSTILKLSLKPLLGMAKIRIV